MNKLLIPTGYMGSGSSAVTDILKSLDGFTAPHGSFEYVFLHCPDGVFDLEDKLLVNNNALRSDEALRSFRKAMKELFDKPLWWPGLYKKNLSPRFMEVTDGFISSLVQFRSNGFWYHQEVRGARAFFPLAFNKVLRMVSNGKINRTAPLLYKGMEISLPTPEEYYSAARRYVDELLSAMGISTTNLVLDQLLLPFNAWRMDNYFGENAECIIVDRDPRDVFLCNKYIWRKRDGNPVPYPDDVNEFCAYYKALRKAERLTDNPHVHRMHFEDLIYSYDRSTDRIMDIAGVSPDAPKPALAFDPETSIENTQLFNLPEFEDEAAVIERELKDYLYDFPEARVPRIERTF